MIDLFRVDCLFPASDTAAVKTFINGQINLPWPDYHGNFVTDHGGVRKTSAFADIIAPIRLVYEESIRNNPDAESPLIIHDWSNDDPLRDILLTTFGGLPPPEDTAEDYLELLGLQLRADLHRVTHSTRLELPNAGKMSLATLNRFGLLPHFPAESHWSFPGFYVGDVASFEDLVAFWNLRAAEIPLQFYDPAQAERLDHVKEQWLGYLQGTPKPDGNRGTAVWFCGTRGVEDLAAFGENLTVCRVDAELWNGLNVRVPTMFFADSQVLASIDRDAEPPSISFSIPDPPATWSGGATEQQYVVSIDPGIGLFRDSRFTLTLPYIPELNEFYGRSAILHWNKARAEPDSFGVVVGGSTTYLSIRAIDVGTLIEAIFKIFGISATPSAAGLICNRLILQMGGIDDCRVFRIGGVRDLYQDSLITTGAPSRAARLT